MIRDAVRTFVQRVRDVRPLAGQVLRDAALRRSWLAGARAAQRSLVVLVLAGAFIVPPVRDAVLSWIFPPVKRGGFLGLGAHDRPRASFQVASGIFTALYWTGGLATAGLLLWLHIPVVLTRPRAGRSTETRTRDAALAGGEGGPAPAWQPASPSPGDTVFAAGTPRTLAARYVIESELGRGGMGVVYRARDEVLGRPVALKQLPAAFHQDAELAARFRREARLLAQLAHPGIVQVYDLVENESGAWMAMELVTGGSLADLVQARRPSTLAEVVRLGVEMADALSCAHAQGVIHRDFKPQNVLLTERGHVKVADFGIAKIVQGPQLTQAGNIMGTPAYMSPEQATGGQVDARSDIYALGLTLYELAAGRLPFEGDSATVLVKHITQEPPRLRDLVVSLPEALDALIMGMLVKDPGQRPADMQAVREALLRLHAPPA